MIAEEHQLRASSTKSLAINPADFEALTIPVSKDFSLELYLTNQGFDSIQSLNRKMGVISVIFLPNETVKIAGVSVNVRRVAKAIEFYDDYVTHLETIESKIRQEKLQFESEKHSFPVKQHLIGLVIGKQGVTKKAIQEKHGVKIYVEDNT